MSVQNKNRVTGLALLLTGAAYAFMSLQIKAPSNPKDPGSALFPLAAGIGLAICGVILLFNRSGKEHAAFFTAAGWRKLVIIMLMMAVYVAGLKHLGFLVMTPFLLFGTSTMFAEGGNVSPAKRVLYSVVLTILLYLVFAKAFNVLLPKGILSF